MFIGTIFQVPTHYVCTNGEVYVGQRVQHPSEKKKVRGGEMLRGKRTYNGDIRSLREFQL